MKRKLRHDKHKSINIEQRQIHLAIHVVKNTLIEDLVDEMVGAFIVVIVQYAKQDEQPKADLANHLITDRNLCR